MYKVICLYFIYFFQGFFPSENTPPVEPPAEQGISEQGQQPVYQHEHGEQGIRPSPPDKETEESLSQEWHPTHQQSDNGQVNGLASLMATGGQASEVSRPIPEMEEIAGHLLNAREKEPDYQRGGDYQSGGGRSNDLSHSLLNGGEVVPRQESLSIQEPGTCQLVNRQHQPRFQQAQANGLSYPSQEISLNAHQRQDIPELPYPIQETRSFAERTPDEHEDLPPCYQQLNGIDINGVSSTGERELAVEHNCLPQELQLWRQVSDR